MGQRQAGLREGCLLASSRSWFFRFLKRGSSGRGVHVLAQACFCIEVSGSLCVFAHACLHARVCLRVYACGGMWVVRVHVGVCEGPSPPPRPCLPFSFLLQWEAHFQKVPFGPLKQSSPPARCPIESLELRLRAGGLASCLDSDAGQQGPEKEPPRNLLVESLRGLRLPQTGPEEEVAWVWRSRKAECSHFHIQVVGGPASLGFPRTHRRL